MDIALVIGLCMKHIGAYRNDRHGTFLTAGHMIITLLISFVAAGFQVEV